MDRGDISFRGILGRIGYWGLSVGFGLRRISGVSELVVSVGTGVSVCGWWFRFAGGGSGSAKVSVWDRCFGFRLVFWFSAGGFGLELVVLVSGGFGLGLVVPVSGGLGLRLEVSV